MTEGGVATAAPAVADWPSPAFNAMELAAAAVILKAVDVAPARPVALVVSVYPVAALLMLKVENVATPAVAATVVVPESVPPFGFVPITTLTVPVKLVTVFPCPSCAVSWTAGVLLPPATVLLG